MKGILVAVVVALVAIPPARAGADETPSKDQLDAAKKAFVDGKALHDQGKLVEAADKFKESYRLSKNALLLYNIGLTLDEAGQKDNALLYYRKFLADAPQGAAQRATASDRVKTLEKEKLDADLAGPAPKAAEPVKAPPPAPAVVAATPTTAAAAETVPATAEPAKPAHPIIKVKPAGTYGASSFQHQLVDTAPPSKPLDVTATVPKDSGFVVTLYYRGKGDAAFTARPMKWRNDEVVARIPAAKMNGSAVQYYIDARDASGNAIAKSGKSTDPNLISIEAGAPTHYYSDLPDDAPVAAAPKRHEAEDPLAVHKTDGEPDQTTGGDQPTEEPAGPTSGGIFDVGSKKFEYTKWSATGAAGLFVIGGVVFYAAASGQASNLVKDANGCGTPPCRPFDSYDKSIQDAGYRFQTMSNIGIGVGVVAAGIAGYYWYRELTSKKHHDTHDTQPTATPSQDFTWIVVPSAGDGFAGATAAARF